MTLKTSLIITGDASVAKAEVAALEAQMAKLADASTAAAADAKTLDAAQKDSAASAKADAGAKQEAAAATDTKAKADRDAAAASAALATSLRDAETANAALSGSLKSALGDVDRLTGEMATQRAALADVRGEMTQVQAANADLAAAARQASDSQQALGEAAGSATDGLRDAAEAARTLADEVENAGSATKAIDATDVDLASGFEKAADAARAFGTDATAAGGAFGDVQATLGQAAAGATSAIVDQDAAIQALGQSVGGTIRSMLEQVAAGGSVMEAFDGHADALAAAFDALGSANVQVGASAEEAGTDFGALGDDVTGTAEKFTDMNGRAGATAALLAGPLGAGIGLVTAALGPMIAELIEGAIGTDHIRARLDEAAASADIFGAAQSSVGQIVDLTTGKLKTQNAVLVETIRLQTQLNLVEAQKKIDAETGRDQRRFAAPVAGSSGMMGMPGGNIDRAIAASKQQRQFDQLRASMVAAIGNDTLAQANPEEYARMVSQSLNLATGALDRMAVSGRVAGRSLFDAKIDLVDLAQVANDKAAAIVSLRAISGEGVSDLIKPDAPARSGSGADAASAGARPAPTPARPPAVPRVDTFGQEALNRIASIAAAFDGTPPVVRQVDSAVRQLDDLIEELGRKKPIDWEATIAGARVTREVVRAAINEPLDDYLRQQDQASQIQNLLIAGRSAEAEALQVVFQIERQRGPLSEQQQETVRETVAYRREEASALERMHRRQSVYLDLVRDTRDAIEDSVQALVRGDLKELIATPKKLIEAYQQAQGRQLFENLFGDSFAALERALTEGPVDKASRRMADGMATATAAVAQLGKAAIVAATEITTGEPADVVVTGNPPPKTDIDSVLRDALGGVAKDIAKLFTSPELAEQIGQQIGAVGAQAMKGAATGRAVGSVASTLGLGGMINGTGSMMGGAVGQGIAGMFGMQLTPLGSILASVAGGLIGSMFEGPTRSGYSSIGTDANGNAVTAISGGRNSEGRQRESLGYAGAVVDGLAKIASSLGGQLGAGLNLGTIGTQGDKYVFDSDGAGSAEGVKLDTLDAAVRAALSSAVSKGAVTGLSDAVRKALSSSSDVDKALAEALKVKQLETLIGGVGAQMKSMLDEFDNTAAERVRLAKTYGLDLIAVEKKNGEDRANLLDDIMKSRVGSLQSLLDDMRYGDLFEGDANERRDQILAEIEDAKQDATAGVDGAGDRLAELYRLLLNTTRENFGTAGDQLSGDRALVQSGAADIIKRETDRINAAATQAKATTDAVMAGNKLADETNDLIATTNARLAGVEAALLGRGGTVGTTIDLRAVARTPEN